MDKIKLSVLVSDEAGGKSDVNGHQNVRKSCLSITEPADDELSRDNKEAYMASVFANCTQTWLESLKYQLGYQLDFNFDYGALNKLQPFPLNNFGDPFMKSNYGVNSKQFEVAVLDWFADLWGIHKDKYWGYITSGSTEANFHAIIMGREIFPDGILYASKESHYSVFKAARMYRMDCIKIKTLTSGEIDCIDFKAKLLQNKDKPAIININIGTTFKAAIDDLDLVIQTLEECGFSHNKFYIHCDGALSGLIIPFVEQAPQISFKKPIHSASVSGHKFLGCPMPCGVLITRVEHINALSKNVEYIASRDVTISCSRNGHAPIFLWYILSKKGHIGLQKDIQKCLQNAKYLKDQLRSAGISVMLNEQSNIVVFERPPDEEFIHRWQLSCQGNIAHVAVMPNVSKEKLDAFLDELVERRSTWSKEEGAHPCVGSDVGYENCVCLLHR